RMCHRPRPLRVGNPKLFLRLPLLRSSSHRHARSLRTSALDYARNFTSESRLSPRTVRLPDQVSPKGAYACELVFVSALLWLFVFAVAFAGASPETYMALHGLVKDATEIKKANGIKKAKARSEEHTSELQSRGHLVCRLLLE